jgi:hypothetical protein
MAERKPTTTPDGSTVLSLGIGVTCPAGSDSYPGTLVDFNEKGTVISFTRDKYERIDKNGAFTEQQEYSYKTDPNAPVEKARWSKKHRCYRTKGGDRVVVGHRRAYQDPCF